VSSHSSSYIFFSFLSFFFLFCPEFLCDCLGSLVLFGFFMLFSLLIY
jgi:hypothetical protein